MPDWYTCDVIGVWLRFLARDLIAPSRCFLAHRDAAAVWDPPPPPS